MEHTQKTKTESKEVAWLIILGQTHKQTHIQYMQHQPEMSSIRVGELIRIDYSTLHEDEGFLFLFFPPLFDRAVSKYLKH